MKMPNMEEIIGQYEKILKAEVIHADATTNKDFFTDKEGNTDGMFENKNGVALTFEIKEKSAEWENTTWQQFFGYPNPQGAKQSNMYAFFKIYGVYPDSENIVGTKVKAKLNNDGFLKVILD